MIRASPDVPWRQVRVDICVIDVAADLRDARTPPSNTLRNCSTIVQGGIAVCEQWPILRAAGNRKPPASLDGIGPRLASRWPIGRKL